MAFLPLTLGSECIGVLTVCATEPDAFEAQELLLLEEAAAHLEAQPGATILAGGTDAPVIPTNPWWSMYHFITRDTITGGVFGPQERVLNVHQYLARYGDGLLDAILEKMEYRLDGGDWTAFSRSASGQPPCGRPRRAGAMRSPPVDGAVDWAAHAASPTANASSHR